MDAGRQLVHRWVDASVARPDIVLYHAGTNDLRPDRDTGISVEDASYHLQRGVAEMLRAAPNATILVAQIIPAGTSDGLPTWAVAVLAAVGATLAIGLALAGAYYLGARRQRTAASAKAVASRLEAS